MQSGNDTLKSKDNDLVWYFLGEYSLSEFIGSKDIEDQHMNESLFQAIRDLGIPLEFIKKIKNTLTRFAGEAMVHFNQERLEFPVYVRLFHLKKMIQDLNSTKTSSQFYAENTLESAQIIEHSDKEMNGGWGYFLVERRGNLTVGPSKGSQILVDLYLYQEGEYSRSPGEDHPVSRSSA